MQRRTQPHSKLARQRAWVRGVSVFFRDQRLGDLPRSWARARGTHGLPAADDSKEAGELCGLHVHALGAYIQVALQEWIPLPSRLLSGWRRHVVDAFAPRQRSWLCFTTCISIPVQLETSMRTTDWSVLQNLPARRQNRPKTVLRRLVLRNFYRSRATWPDQQETRRPSTQRQTPGAQGHNRIERGGHQWRVSTSPASLPFCAVRGPQASRRNGRTEPSQPGLHTPIKGAEHAPPCVLPISFHSTVHAPRRRGRAEAV